MSCSSAPTTAPILHPYAAFCPQTTPKQHCKCAHRCPNASLFPALLAPSATSSCDNREQGAVWGRCWRIGGLQLGTAQSRAHYVPIACPSSAEYRKAAPIAGVCMGVGWLIGAALQGMGVRRQTSRSQSVCRQRCGPDLFPACVDSLSWGWHCSLVLHRWFTDIHWYLTAP